MAISHGGHLLLNRRDLLPSAVRLLGPHQFGSNSVDEGEVILPLHRLHELLQNVVCILIFDHLEQVTLASRLFWRREDFCHELSLLLVGAKCKALFNDVASEFVSRESNHVLFYDADHFLPIFWQAVLDEGLSNVVAVLVRDERTAGLMEFMDNPRVEVRRLPRLLQDPLDDTAAVGMVRECTNLTAERFEDESDMLVWHTFDGLLDDMIPVLILDKPHDVWFELIGKTNLLIDENMFERLKS